MSVFNRLHFYKRFDFSKDFVAIRPFVTGGVEYKIGDEFDKLSMPKHKVQAMFNSRKITYAEALYNPAVVAQVVQGDEDLETVVEGTETSEQENDLTNTDNSDNLMPEIKPAGPAWFKVWLGEEQIGKAVRTRDEAEKIVEEWLDEKTK